MDDDVTGTPEKNRHIDLCGCVCVCGCVCMCVYTARSGRILANGMGKMMSPSKSDVPKITRPATGPKRGEKALEHANLSDCSLAY